MKYWAEGYVNVYVDATFEADNEEDAREKARKALGNAPLPSRGVGGEITVWNVREIEE
jgi:hypothetical protein